MSLLSALLVSATLINPSYAAPGAKASTTTLSASASQVYVGTPVTFTATVSGSGGPSGTVAFTTGPTPLGTCTLDNKGVCTLAYTFTERNDYPVVAAYTPTSNHLPSTSAPLTINVIRYTTTSVVTGSHLSAIIDDPLSFTTTVSSAGGTPTGDIILHAYDTGDQIGTCALVSGTCTINLVASTVGHHKVWATYGGDSKFSGSTSAIIYQDNTAKHSPTVAVTVTPTPSDIGTTITITATVTGDIGTPEGSVIIEDGETPLQTCTLASGTCSITTNALGVGTHAIKGEYSPRTGNPSPYTGAYQIVAHTVNALKTEGSLSLTSSLNPSMEGNAVTWTATVAGTGTPTGTVTLKEGSTPIGICTLASATCTISSSALTVGTHTLTGSYSGDGTHTASTSTLVQIVSVLRHVSVLTVTSSANPSPRLTAVTYTITLNAKSTEIINAEINQEIVKSCVLVISGETSSCSLSLSFGTIGTTELEFEFAGDATNTAATTDYDQVVGLPKPTLTISADKSAIKYGETVVYTATLSETTANGSVQFIDESGRSFVGCTLVSGTCAMDFFRHALGTHTIHGEYSGEINKFAGSSSSNISLDVTKGNSTTTLVSLENPYAFGTTLEIHADVVAYGSGATGTIQFEEINGGETILGTCTLVGTGCSLILTTPLSVGTHNLVAEYSGDSNYLGSSSAQVIQTITDSGTNPPPTPTKYSVTPIFTVSDTNLTYQSPLTMTIKLTSTGGTPTGSVAFEEIVSPGDVITGTCTLAAGACTYTTTQTPVGTHIFYAEYNGTDTFLGVGSSRITVVITAKPAPAKEPVAKEPTTTAPLAPPTEIITFGNSINLKYDATKALEKDYKSESGSKISKLVIPAGALPSGATITLRPTSTPDARNRKLPAAEIAISTLSGAITTLTKPLELTMTKTASRSIPYFTIDGIHWTKIPQIYATTLSPTQGDGYYINSNNQLVILTLHTTTFALRLDQFGIAVHVEVRKLKPNRSLNLATRGGTGAGDITYATSTPTICSVKGSELTALKVGNCLVTTTKASDGAYNAATSKPMTIYIRN